MRENNFNFGATIYLKSRAECQAANRYAQCYDDATDKHIKSEAMKKTLLIITTLAA
ncbi:MAG: hypothetical protein RL308_2981, partial [Bacteroidota bacterium]